MKKDNSSLKSPSSELTEKVMRKIEKPYTRKLMITKPSMLSSWPFKLVVVLGVLLIIALGTRVKSISNDDTAIVGMGVLLLAIAGFLIPIVLNYVKNQKKL
ncbi:hypothetical protein SAMN05661096_02388 [Marivirga sericea]|uniref:Uncharacterized protein n=1 Tax=Marivirga sericea TaxID=1028 RepID=A0A1X7K5L4_9BACT|nr:hypothetical protein [Marivirga sericea]SMG35924.1 hypothetical protein SAMN05661096_02388 [Marivirga sericea]